MGSCNSTKSSGAAGNKNNKTESSPNVGKKAGDEAFCPYGESYNILMLF